MRPKTGYRRFWYLAAFLFLICLIPDASAGMNKTSDQGKPMGLHQENDIQVVAQRERAEDHRDRSETKWTDVAGKAGSVPVVNGKTLEEWVRKLESRDPNDRINACMALEKMGLAARPAIPALRQALKDEDVTVRILAASALGGLGPDAATAVPDLVVAMEDKNEYVRVFAVTALGKIGASARDGTKALQNALNDPHVLVRSQAEWALQQIGVQKQSAQEEGTQTKSSEVKSYTPDSPQESPSRSFHYQEQQLNVDPLKPALDDPQFNQASALFQAAGFGNLTEVKSLLEQNITPYMVIDETRRTPLHEAATFGHSEVVRALIQAAIDRDQLPLVINARDQLGRTPLHDASFGGHVAVVGILLDHGALINTADMDGLNPIHFAVIREDNKMAKFLLGRGAYVLARDTEGRTPKDYARALHHDELAQSLDKEAQQYWQAPTVIEIRATIENYLAAFRSGDVSAARTISTKDHDLILGDSIKALSFQHVIEDIQWQKDTAQATVRIKMPSGMIPFFGFFDLKKSKEGWKVDDTNYGLIQKWEDMK
jgi:ankyrin repeat protein